MKRVLLTIAAMTAVAGIAVPFATADHKPNHGKPPRNTDLSLSATPNPVLWSLPVTFSGKLKGSDNSGKTVELQASPAPYSAPYTTVKTATTDAQGDYSLSFVPGKNTNYRARVAVAGSPEQLTAGLLVRVRMKVSRSVSDRTPAKGQTVTFAGRVSPAHDGRQVYIQRLASDGKYATVAQATLADAGASHPVSSSYTRNLRIFKDGTFRVLVRSDGDHMRNTSRKIRLDVP